MEPIAGVGGENTGGERDGRRGENRNTFSGKAGIADSYGKERSLRVRIPYEKGGVQQGET